MNSLKNKKDKMKKNYIQPEIITSLRYEMEKPLCVSGGSRNSNFGVFGGGDYANADWYNQGYDQSSADSKVPIENDNGFLNSQSKGRGSDWGTIW